MTDDASRDTRLSNTDRVETFSDGVMAIAITLLILEIRLPPGDDGVLRGLLHLWPSYLAFVVSFLTIGVVWRGHHDFFRRLDRMDQTLMWWNLALLLAVAFIPFPTAVLAEYLPHGGWDSRVAVAFYCFAGVLQFPWIFMWRRVVRRPELLGPGLDPGYARRGLRTAGIGIALYACCVGVALVAPVVALVAFFGMVVYYMLPVRA